MPEQLPDIHPYTMIWRDEILDYGNQQFRIIIYGAYNAFGLIGPEVNGIAIFDEQRRVILADRIAKQDSGYFGSSQLQEDTVNSLLSFTREQFCNFINALPPGHARYSVELIGNTWDWDPRGDSE